MKPKVNLVWLKRDIRTQNHLPLQWAEQAGLPYYILYIWEPSLLNYPDTSLRHLQFQYHSLADFNQRLAPFQLRAEICYAEVLTVFNHILEQFEVENLFSYQESGIALSYERDKAVQHFCRGKGIKWREFQRDGILRGSKDRKGWDQAWQATMNQPLVQNTYKKAVSELPPLAFPLPAGLHKQLSDYPKTFQPAGEQYAFRYLHSFVQGRVANYARHISKPSESRTACTRLSPYLAWGNLSVAQVYQTLQQAKSHYPHYARNLDNALMRLFWHCHFIQKFEMQCDYESKFLNEGFNGLVFSDNQAHLEAWKTGNTGVPLIDACMRCLHHTGWINFRMRAMLVSFACHYLWLDWRKIAHHLAQLFLDYEPGIHYPQIQMQAGTTGINTLRIYNPLKQAQDHDSQGIFLKKWIPALQNVPEKYIHQPHLMSEAEQKLYACVLGTDYSFPVLEDMEGTIKRNKAEIWAWQQKPEVLQHSLAILARHTRRGSV